MKILSVYKHTVLYNKLRTFPPHWLRPTRKPDQLVFNKLQYLYHKLPTLRNISPVKNNVYRQTSAAMINTEFLIRFIQKQT